MKIFTGVMIIINLSLLSLPAFGNFQQERFEKQRDLIIKLTESDELKGDKEMCSFIVQQFNDLLHLNKITSALIGEEPAEMQELNSEEVCK